MSDCWCDSSFSSTLIRARERYDDHDSRTTVNDRNDGIRIGSRRKRIYNRVFLFFSSTRCPSDRETNAPRSGGIQVGAMGVTVVCRA